jgi:hypothetical protein
MIRALAHDPKRIRFARGRDQQTTN